MKFIILILLVTSHVSMAWDGTDENGNSVEIESGNLVRPGNDIDVLVDGEYKTFEVESVSSGEVEVYDSETGEYDTFDMD